MEEDNKVTSDNTKAIDQDEILKNVMKEIERAYGKGAIMKLGDKSNLTIEAISTGSLLLDEAIGVGGYPKGRIVEIFGPESSGKNNIVFACHCWSTKKRMVEELLLMQSML